MGDIADILGVQKGPELTDGQQATKIMEGAPGVDRPVKMKKPKGMSREVYDLVGPAGLLPAMETKKPISSGFKEKRVSATKGKWIWAPFNSTARSDNQTFYHWAKADVQYNDYPYSKYNIKLADNLNPVYSDSEYNALLQTRGWTRSETDMLMHLCHKYDVRWPVIVDRYQGVPPRSLEELQARYLTVQHKLKLARATKHNPREMSIGIDIRSERNRRTLHDYVIRRSKEEEEEITKLKESLKTVEATLRKHKQLPAQTPKAGSAAAAKQNKGNKTSSTAERQGLAARKGAARLPASAGAGAGSSSSSSSSSSGGAGVGGLASDESATFEPESLMLMPGKPTLQSLRIPIPDQKTNISKTLLKKMTGLLRDLGVPEAPIATRTSLDFLDSVRQSAVALLSIQSVIARRERELATIHAKAKEEASMASSSGGGGNIPAQSVAVPPGVIPAPSAPPPAPPLPTSATVPVNSAGGIRVSTQPQPQHQPQAQAQAQAPAQAPHIKTEAVSSATSGIGGVAIPAPVNQTGIADNQTGIAGADKRPLDVAEEVSPKRRRAARE
jgi:hypothetical protein